LVFSEQWAKQRCLTLSLLLGDSGRLRVPVVVPGKAWRDMEVEVIDLLPGRAVVLANCRARRVCGLLDGAGGVTDSLKKRAKVCIRHVVKVRHVSSGCEQHTPLVPRRLEAGRKDDD